MTHLPSSFDPRRSRLTFSILAVWLTLSGLPVAAQTDEASPVAEEMIADAGDAASASAATSPAIFDRVMVVGSASQEAEIPGSAQYIGTESLQEQEYGDIHRILRRVPGVNIQEEEGYGLRPNIGMRGTGVERSQKITLMEDGVLIAPAPYAAPSAYYFPTVGRMEGIEVRKGSSSIRQGPYTNGGVLNMLSTSIPSRLSGRVTAAAGDDDLLKLHGVVGDTRERFGWLVETYQMETDGFKELDGGGSTGVDIEDYVGKLRFNSSMDARRYQALEIKLGATEQFGNETYIGLTEGDFARNPLRRYAGSREDDITTDHEQYQLRHFFQATQRLDLTTTAYRNDFFRNWHKLEKVGGVGASSILADPERYADELAILRGELDDTSGALAVRNNRRDYYSQGVEVRLGYRFGSGVTHEIEAGLRYHEDEEDRFQEEDLFDIVGGRTALNRLGAPGSHANRIAEAEAVAFFVQDRIVAGRWAITPGVRFESVDFLRRDFGRADPDRTGASLSIRENDVDVWIPGVGVTFAASDRVSLFGGVHKGFSPPGPGRDERTDAEESVNYEVGARWSDADSSLTAVAFFNDYENLLGTDTVSGGGSGTGDQFNGGEVEVKGLELGFDTDLARFVGSPLALPLRLAYTYTSAEFGSSFTTSFADWAPQVERGDELPYLPEQQWSLGVGVVGERWSVRGDWSFVEGVRTRPGQGPIGAGEGTEDGSVVDLSAELRLPFQLRLSGRIRNLTDETFIVARRPAGLRPAMPRTALIGLTWDF